MPLTKLQFRPGINKDITTYANEGGWYDCDKVRFRFGFPEKIGGWARLSNATFLGTCRALLPWVALDSSRYLGVGTNLKYYINEGGGYNDITPIRKTTAAGNVTFSAAANTLAADVTVIDATISLTSATGFPASGLIKIDSEEIRYAAVVGNSLMGVTRGINGTTPATHTATTVVDCATIIVTSAGSGVLEHDFVTFSGASTLGDAITADILNQEYQVVQLLTSDTYTVEARTVSTIVDITTATGLDPTYVFATASDSGNGGAAVIGAYQINTGLDTTVTGTGWGAGVWSRGAWGSGATSLASGAKLRLWTHDNFGEDLVFNVRDGGIYYWDKTNGLTTRGVALASLPGSNLAPTIAKQVMISDRDRHVIAFGCDSEDNIGVQDPMLIRFSDQENLSDWQTLSTNTAGSLQLSSGSEIVLALEARQQTLVFTDTALYGMQFLGPPYTFGLQLLSENINIASPMAAVTVDEQAFWMCLTDFYYYNGAVTRLPCAVRDYVFDDMNRLQLSKITAALNTENSEVWWFYPSAASSENDRYVVFNYMEQTWYYGNMARTAWVERGIEDYPIAASTDHNLYNHEFGSDDGSTTPAQAINAYIASSPMDLGDGEKFTFVRRLLPDVGFRDSTSDTPALNITTRVRNFSGASFSKETTSTILESTDQVHLRLRGRQFSIRVESTDVGVDWRLGALRYGLQPDGRR